MALKAQRQCQRALEATRFRYPRYGSRQAGQATQLGRTCLGCAFVNEYDRMTKGLLVNGVWGRQIVSAHTGIQRRCAPSYSSPPRVLERLLSLRTGCT